MLDTTTKRRIDNARDILVGKVPDPKSQVEQITIALIYKFMDDMDAEAEDLGGKRKFFTGDFAQYGWSKLMSTGMGGHELIALYSEGIATMPQNTGIPPLFRDIFKNAYLPYRDPETLKSFLKIIDEFSYDHSERLGDAYEYLLSVLGSQGDAGQFRTPRHIIDFMVEILNPQKHETMGDTACGTAGFLISAYKHVLKHNSSDYQPEPNTVEAAKDVPLELLTVDSPLHYKGDLLTPDERKRLAENIKGYDISPDMVRMSLVNLYLHGFNDPHIVEYDTLTSEARWDEYFDVIFANPPFMSPKGGIKPHKRFSIQAKRSEVLFVDYIAEHLTPTGRAGIIVPEGIIFQSQTAYKALRKMLVDTALVAVISLPAGVFQPYSGVKTSILILDKTLAKQSDRVAFFKIENDGFGLGAQRRAVAGEQLSQVKRELAEFLQAVGSEEVGEVGKPELGLIVQKVKIAENGEYNLSGERYRVGVERVTRYPISKLGDIAEVVAGQSPPGESYNCEGNGVAFYQGKTEFGDIFIGPPTTWTTEPKRFADFGDILMSVRAPVGPVNLATQKICIGRGLAAIKSIKNKLMPLYAFYFLRNQEENIKGDAGSTFSSINRSDIEALKIPLPPIEIQKEIVAEIEGYQKVINGARAVLDNYRPHIPIHPDWPIVPLSDLFITKSGTTPRRDNSNYFTNGYIPWVKTLDLNNSAIQCTEEKVTDLALAETHLDILPKGTVLVAMYGGFNQIGRTGVLEIEAVHNQAMTALLPTPKVSPYYLNAILVSSREYWKSVANSTRKDPNITKSDVINFKLPLPNIETQLAIVAEIEAEKALVAANRELITRFEKKIQATLARVWGEEPEQENSL